MKLLKKLWFPLVLLILIVILLLGTCKKTKALEYPIGAGDNLQITVLDSNSAYLGIYVPNVASNIDINTLRINIPNNNDYYYLSHRLTGSDYDLRLIYYNSTSNQYLTQWIRTVPIDNYLSTAAYFGYDGDADQMMLMCRINYINNNQPAVSLVSYAFSIQSQDDTNDQILTAYNNGTLTIRGVYTNFIGVFSQFYIDYLDYMGSFSEISAEVFGDYEGYMFTNGDRLYQKGYTAGYSVGHDAGYQQGWDDGYAAGHTAGYNSGYTVGYNAGVNDNETAFNRGYDEGLADGYADGRLAGYDDGYADGYEIGEQAGLQGATPVSQTVTLIGSIFGAIGTVLSIQLFPGFTLGLLILVPLFFAVLGLILWIWRRN